MKLITSNKNKKVEFKRLFGTYPIIIESGVEYPEVLGTINETIIYKSLDYGENTIVEDTTAIINCQQYIDLEKVCSGIIQNGEVMTEIKHRYKELKTGDYIKNISSLAINRNGEILVFRGTMFGIVDTSLGNEGLESFMTPILGEDTLNGTMKELTNRGFRDLISWRAIAVRRFKLFEQTEKENGFNPSPYMYNASRPVLRIKIKDIPKWEGEYQDE